MKCLVAQLKTKEVSEDNLNKNELSFSKEIAETLGIESAIILSLYKDNKLDDISSKQGLLESVKKNISFIDDQTINSCLTKLIRFNLLKIQNIKKNTTQRHTPSKLIQVLDIPRTKSGKIVELAVKKVIQGEDVKNIESIANPNSLKLYENLKELKS